MRVNTLIKRNIGAFTVKPPKGTMKPEQVVEIEEILKRHGLEPHIAAMIAWEIWNKLNEPEF